MTHPFNWIVLFPSDPAPEEPGRISPPRITRTMRTGSNDCYFPSKNHADHADGVQWLLAGFCSKTSFEDWRERPSQDTEWDFLHAHVADMIIILNVVMCRILTILAVFKGQVQVTKGVYFDCLKLTELKWTVLTLSTAFCVFQSIWYAVFWLANRPCVNFCVRLWECA